MQQQDQKNVSRRDVIKAAGVLSLGLMYTKPFVEVIQAKPAFESYGDSTQGNNGVGNGEDPNRPETHPLMTALGPALVIPAIRVDCNNLNSQILKISRS